MSLFLTVGAMAQDPVLELTADQIGTEYPKQLSDDDAAKVYALTDLTVAVRINTKSVSGRMSLFATSDPTKAANTDAEGTNSRYVGFGMNGADVGYLASWRTGDRFTGKTHSGIVANSNDMIVVYVINPANKIFRAYVNGVQERAWENAHNDGFMSGYEIATPGMVKADHSNACIYIGGAKNSGGDSEVFNGTITGVKVYSGALSATEVAAISFEDPALLTEARAKYDAAKAAAKAILDEANLVVTTTELSLQANNENNPYYLWCNKPETAEGNINALFDGGLDGFFHTNWKAGNNQPRYHWIEVDLGEGNALSEFSFSYSTRKNVSNDFPDAIEVLGSNEKDANFTSLYTVNSGLPQSGGATWGPALVSSETAYRYIRFNVDAERTYWHMSEFNMFTNNISVAAKYAEVANKVAELKSTYDAYANVNNNIADLNAAAAAINALVEAVNAGVVIPEFYDTIDKPTYSVPAGNNNNCTLIAGIEFAGSNMTGFDFAKAKTSKFVMPKVEAGQTYELKLTYQLNFGDLAIFQIDENSTEMVYGYYQAGWRANNGNPYILLSENAAKIEEQIGISFDNLVNYVQSGKHYIEIPYQITIDESLEPGDFTVVRLMVGKGAPAYNQKNIEEGGCLDLVFEVKQNYTLNVSNVGFSTLMLGYNSIIPSNVKAYTVSAINDGSVDLTQVQGVLPANAPVVIEAEQGEYCFVETTEARQEELGNNWLEGTLADAVIQKAEGWSYYVLGVVDGQVGFYNAKLGEDNTKFKNTANKAYLLVQGKSPIASYSFRFNEGTTNVENVVVENEVKAIYDLTGRRIEAITAPGIYIVNGKKVLVK